MLTFLTELTDFLRNSSTVDHSLKEFVSKYEDLIVSTNIYNSWDKLRATWVKRYKEALKKEKKVGNASEKALCRVEDEVWKQLYQTTVSTAAYYLTNSFAYTPIYSK